MKKSHKPGTKDFDVTIARSLYFARAEMRMAPGVEPAGPAAAYEQQLDRSWSAYIFELSTPILHTGDFTEVIQGDHFRIYPPFNIGKGGGPMIAEDYAYVPDGNPETDWYERFDYRTANGAIIYPPGDQSRTAFRAYGLRIDARNIQYSMFVFRRILNLIRCNTLQWWLSSAYNPFDPRIRFSNDLDHRSRFLLNRKNIEDGTPLSGRYPMTGAVRLLGIETTLNEPIWSNIRAAAIDSFRIPIANSLFCDALDKYFQADDNAAILSLAIYLDAAEAEERKRAGIKSQKNAKRDLRKNPQIIRYGNMDVLKKLFVDRDNIAHAKDPVHATPGNDALMNQYILECLKIFFFLQKQRGVISDVQVL